MLATRFKILHEGKNTIIYYQEDSEFEKPAILKVIKHEHATPEIIDFFENEYKISQLLDFDGVRKVYKKTKVEEKMTLVMEYLEGDTLKEFRQKQEISVETFLKIALRICHILGEIHQRHIIHKDIDSENILIDKDLEVKIIDFGISDNLNQKKAQVSPSEKLEGTIAYISPEQTGRMNRVVDYRSDLYSLGVVFYELLTGQLPFTSNDPMELVHSHLAVSPEAPRQLNPRIPETVSDIVLKLMRKNPEDRYQSAYGLKADIEKCLEMLQEQGRIDSFELAKKDFSGKLNIPNKLYGRQKEIDYLLDAFERTCQGTSELIFIAGYSGVGKSALVHQIQKPIKERKGFFIEGKFDQFQKNVPYFAFIQAFSSFVNLLLTESASELEQWKTKILDAVGEDGKVLTDVIPALELIIGKQPEMAELGPAEAQNRFKHVFQNFTNAISRREHPLVIFIDDWQWADSASLNLMQALSTNRAEEYTLILGAYRSNEIEASHPFMLMLEEIRKESIKVQTLKIENLSLANISELLENTLDKNRDEVAGLADLLYQKTRGNAFFIKQMLHSLYEEGVLFFDYEFCAWTWDFNKIEVLNITENVVELMASKIQKLPADTQNALKLASCVGNRFQLSTLSLVNEDTQGENTKIIRELLESALQEGLVIPLDDGYKFAHDRIQQAVQSLIPEEDRKHIHLKIGRLLVEHIPLEKRDEQLFDVVNQWNFGIDLIEDTQEKRFLSELNLKAGKKARASAAYRPAFNYLKIATDLLPEDSWEKDYDFTLDAYSEILQAAFLKGDLELTEKFIQVVLEKAQDTLDKMPAFEIEMQYHIARGDQLSALDAGLRVIRLLDIPLASAPLPDIDVDKIWDLPKNEDERVQAAMEIMDSIITPAWALNPELFEQITFTMVNLSVTHGNSASACVGYAFYGSLLCAKLEDIETGYKFGKLAIRLLDRFNAKFFKAKVDNLFASRVMHWKEPARAARKIHFEAIQVGLETGEIEFACYNVVESCHYSFLVGIDLTSLEQEYATNLALIKKLKQEFHVNYLTPWQQMIHNLTSIHEGNDPTQLKGELFDEDVSLPAFVKDNQLTLAFITYQAKMLLAYLLRDYNSAYESALQAEKYIDGVTGMLFLPVHKFYYSLILIARFPNVPIEDKQDLLDQINENQRILEFWAKYSPHDCQHKYDLVMAETMRLSGQNTKAMDLYDAAIDGAKVHKYLQEEALANELATAFYFAQNKHKIARTYLQDAYYSYQLWGAKRKLKDLETHYKGQMRSNPNINLWQDSNSASEGTSFNPNLDIYTIIKASQTLSGEVVLGNLLKKMMRIVIENAGADKGLFIQLKGSRWVIEAECNLKNAEVEALQSIPIEEVNGNSEHPKLASELVYYVIRTQKNLVINNASEEGNMINRAYIEKCNPKSILCMPLLYHGELSGILYLENNLTTFAFTPDRLEILEILSSQITISIENALLYENLEEKVKERTAEVVQAKEIIEKKNQNITASINYAKRIQDATLPQMKKFKSILPESFLLFKPRDIVSGDFYWCSKLDPQPIYEEVQEDNQTKTVLKGHQSGKIIVTAVDCTGHGVPGAFMSMIGNDLLNDVVDIKKNTDPAEILQELHEGVRAALRQRETDNKDGMDLALCVIDEENKQLEFAGAKNPLIYMSNGQLHHVRGDKMAIGGVQKEGKLTRVYSKHVIPLEGEMTFYIFSDGFQDQFGGQEGRKFMLRRFKRLIQEIHQMPMEEQGKVLQRTIEDWMQGHKQIDDILVIGFRIT